MSRNNLAVLCDERFLLRECELGKDEETDTTDVGKTAVGGSSELRASGTESCKQGQCGDSLCLEAG